ncbi:MFS transporter [Puia sp. P3]|uniref:MFS transporter n=1 Tax=Puia sp. P3 TaxID=3423952 RepID=UPI003D672BB2
MIPHLKKACELNDTQSSLVDFPIYLAYCVIAIPAGLFMHKYGYKRGIIFGLILYALGALLFIPAASERSFPFFIFALFVSGSGAAFPETVANPYIANLGEPSKSEQRLNLAQSFNGLGAMVAPLVGAQFILSGIEHTPQELATMKANGQAGGLSAVGGEYGKAALSGDCVCGESWLPSASFSQNYLR